MADFDQRREYDEGGEEVYSKPVRAGKRTYFFDVKATRNDDYYLTITESRKKTGRDGGVFYEKHKIFLYKEDFARFTEGLSDVVEFVMRRKPEFFAAQQAGEGRDFSNDAVAPASGTADTVADTGLSIDEEFDRL
jgi:hypothetical protein